MLNALQGFGDSALYGVMLLVVFLKFLRSKVLGEAQDLLVRLLSRANFRFPLFLGLLVGGYKAVLRGPVERTGCRKSQWMSSHPSHGSCWDSSCWP